MSEPIQRASFSDRVGNVIMWAGLIFACAVWAAGGGLAGFGLAFLIGLVGWTLRYLITGRSD